MRSKDLSAESSAAIRSLFMNPRPYSFDEAAEVLGVERAILVNEADASELETISVSGERRLPWGEVAYCALREWPIETIFAALGADASGYVPELLRPTQLAVTLPAYQVRMLEVLAHHERLDAGTFLQLHLLDLASASDQTILEEEIPGFIEALRFPYGGRA